jgi:nucleoside-diphosphate-sugar epimerase
MGVIFTGQNSYLYKSFTIKFKEELVKLSENQLILIGYKSPSTPLENNLELFKYNTQRIEYTLRSCEELKISKIIFFSGISVYGQRWDGISNNPSPHPNDFYSHSKLYCEEKIINYAKKFNAHYYILRTPGIVGPHSKRNFISRLRDSIALSTEIDISKLTHQFNNLITSRGIEKIISQILSKHINSGIYNLASVSPISIHTIIKIIEEFYLKKCVYRVNNSIKERIISTDLIEDIFNYKETVEDAIRYALGENEIKDRLPQSGKSKFK